MRTVLGTSIARCLRASALLLGVVAGGIAFAREGYAHGGQYSAPPPPPPTTWPPGTRPGPGTPVTPPTGGTMPPTGAGPITPGTGGETTGRRGRPASAVTDDWVTWW